MKVMVLKELPQGQQPGDIIDITEAEANVLMLTNVEAVRPIQDDVPRLRRQYKRRDLTAED